MIRYSECMTETVRMLDDGEIGLIDNFILMWIAAPLSMIANLPVFLIGWHSLRKKARGESS